MKTDLRTDAQRERDRLAQWFSRTHGEARPRGEPSTCYNCKEVWPCSAIQAAELLRAPHPAATEAVEGTVRHNWQFEAGKHTLSIDVFNGPDWPKGTLVAVLPAAPPPRAEEARE